ncbi:MAG: hypothetical protein C9356_02005 [Oleiphilus sp.]|nr:MAG: hypothetical protein C9356_02005 [Oleiphilus sp.]
MPPSTTIVITPRDRYTGIEECIEQVYRYTDPNDFQLQVLDLGYPKTILKRVKAMLSEKSNARVISLGRIIPMAAIDKIRGDLTTPHVVFLDNDSRVTEGWLPPLVKAAQAEDVGVVYPVTLEREGVDQGASIRNHLYTTELRVVDYNDEPFLIEEKSYRRALPEDIPDETAESNAFELHCVMFNTDALQAIEIPMMTIREHLDIGMQLNAMGKKLLVIPQSRIIFDNLGTRASLGDLQYFNLRWNANITNHSSRLFEKRWGYRFYSEPSIYNWASRRRLFLLMRWAYLPIGIANFIDRFVSAMKRRFFPIWDPLSDPNGQSRKLYDDFNGHPPPQKDHSVK